MKEKVKAIAVQMPIPDEADRDGNLATAVRLLEEAGARRPDLVCLPELFAGLKVHSRLDGPETRAVGQVARKHRMYVIAPLYIEEGGAVYNCSVLIDRQGQAAGCYHKVHLWPWEAPVFGVKAGDSFPVFQPDFGPLGLCICHDHQFPETARALALGGAEVVHCATRMPDPFQLPWLEFSLVRSLENQLYVISVGNSANESSTHIVAPRFRGAVLAACGPGSMRILRRL